MNFTPERARQLVRKAERILNKIYTFETKDNA